VIIIVNNLISIMSDEKPVNPFSESLPGAEEEVPPHMVWDGLVPFTTPPHQTHRQDQQPNQRWTDSPQAPFGSPVIPTGAFANDKRYITSSPNEGTRAFPNEFLPGLSPIPNMAFQGSPIIPRDAAGAGRGGEGTFNVTPLSPAGGGGGGASNVGGGGGRGGGLNETFNAPNVPMSPGYRGTWNPADNYLFPGGKPFIRAPEERDSFQGAAGGGGGGASNVGGGGGGGPMSYSNNQEPSWLQAGQRNGTTSSGGGGQGSPPSHLESSMSKMIDPSMEVNRANERSGQGNELSPGGGGGQGNRTLDMGGGGGQGRSPQPGFQINDSSQGPFNYSQEPSWLQSGQGGNGTTSSGGSPAQGGGGRQGNESYNVVPMSSGRGGQERSPQGSPPSQINDSSQGPLNYSQEPSWLQAGNGTIMSPGGGGQGSAQGGGSFNVGGVQGNRTFNVTPLLSPGGGGQGRSPQGSGGGRGSPGDSQGPPLDYSGEPSWLQGGGGGGRSPQGPASRRPLNISQQLESAMSQIIDPNISLEANSMDNEGTGKIPQAVMDTLRQTIHTERDQLKEELIKDVLPTTIENCANVCKRRSHKRSTNFFLFFLNSGGRGWPRG
jgi:hypothetical protein